MIKYIFPFGQVNRDNKIIIYGYGNVGRAYIEQIQSIDYCDIVAVADRMADYLVERDIRLIKPVDIVQEDFDKIIIAIQNVEKSKDVRDFLVNLGINKEKIVSECKKIADNDVAKPHIVKSRYYDNIIHVGVEGCGGLGDVILTLPFLKKLKDILGDKLELSFVSRYDEIFKYTPILSCLSKGKEEVPYDVLFCNLHVPRLIYWDPDKTKEISVDFYHYLSDLNYFRGQSLNAIDGDYLWHYARVLHKKRFNICDFNNRLGIQEICSNLIECPTNEDEVLKRYGLYKKKYITINRDVDIHCNMANFKLWPDEYYSNLLKIIKSNFSDIDVVRVGSRSGADIIDNIDIDLTGKTGLGELIVILKNSKLLISSEGGLVHLNHFIGGKSAVIYGPTDEEYFGYDNDICCVNRRPCSMPCQYLSSDYTCPIRPGIPQCISNVTPSMVYDSIVGYLTNVCRGEL